MSYDEHPPKMPPIDTESAQALLGRLDQFEQSVRGMREFLRSQGIDPDQRPVSGAYPQPRSDNPLVQRDTIPFDPEVSLPNGSSRPSRWQPEPELGNESELPSPKVFPIDRWTEIFFRPGMAQAMLYVLLPVIEQAVRARTPQEAEAAVEQMETWQELTVAQRVALTDLFRWMEIEMSSQESVIPRHLLSNMQAASDAYDHGMPQAH